MKTSSPKKIYQQFIFRAFDDEDTPVPHYKLSFFLIKNIHKKKLKSGFSDEELDENEREFSDRLMEILMTEHFYENSKDKSLKRILVDWSELIELYQYIREKWNGKYIMIARIRIPRKMNGIEYRSNNLQDAIIYESKNKSEYIPEIFKGNTTILVEIRVRRARSEYVRVTEFEG